MNNYHWLLFDADETLFDFPQSERLAIIRTLKNYSLPYDEKTISLYSQINDSLWQRFNRNEIPREQIRRERFSRLLAELGGDVSLGPDMDRFYAESLGSFGILLPGALDLCRTLSHSFELAIITNGFSVSQHGRFDHSPVREFVPHLFISEDLQCQKPQKEFFDKVLSAMGIPGERKNQVLVIGDSLTSDIQGGINAGMDTCWYCPSGQQSTLPTYIIRNYEELLELLEVPV